MPALHRTDCEATREKTPRVAQESTSGDYCQVDRKHVGLHHQRSFSRASKRLECRNLETLRMTLCLKSAFSRQQTSRPPVSRTRLATVTEKEPKAEMKAFPNPYIRSQLVLFFIANEFFFCMGRIFKIHDKNKVPPINEFIR